MLPYISGINHTLNLEISAKPILSLSVGTLLHRSAQMDGFHCVKETKNLLMKVLYFAPKKNNYEFPLAKFSFFVFFEIW